MKKLLSLVLAVLMVISCMTYLFTGTVSAEDTATAESLPENLIKDPATKTLTASDEPVLFADYNVFDNTAGVSKVLPGEFHQFDFDISVSDDATGDIRVYILPFSNASVQSSSYLAGIRNSVDDPTDISVAYAYGNHNGNINYDFIGYKNENCEWYVKGFAGSEDWYNKRVEEYPDNDIRYEYPTNSVAQTVAAGDEYNYSYVIRVNSKWSTHMVVVVEGLTAGSVTVSNPNIMNLTNTDHSLYAYDYSVYNQAVIGALKKENDNVFVRIVPNNYTAGTATGDNRAVLSTRNGSALYNMTVEGGKFYRFDADIRFPAGVHQGTFQAPQFDFFESVCVNHGKIYEALGDEKEYIINSGKKDTDQIYYGENTNAYAYTYNNADSSLLNRRPAATLPFSTTAYYTADGTLVVQKTSGNSQNGRENGAALKDYGNVWLDYNYEFTGISESLIDTMKHYKQNYAGNYALLKYQLNETEDGIVANSNTAAKNVLLPSTDAKVALGAYFYDVMDIDAPEFNEVATLSVASEGNGAAGVSATSALVGDEVVYTAKSFGDDKFIGWYNGDELVSEDAVYTLTVEGDTTLTAKFTGSKVVWQEKTYLSVAEDINAAPYDKGPVYKVYDTINYQHMYTVLEGLEPNTRYTFTTYLKGNIKYAGSVGVYRVVDGKAESSGCWVVPLASGLENNLQNGTVWDNGNYWPGEGYENGNLLKSITTDEFVDTNTWRKVVYDFKTNDTDTDYILTFKFEGPYDSDTQICYVSDSNITEYVKVAGADVDAPTVASVTSDTVTLTAVDGYEYKMGDGDWQTSNVFTGLTPETEYTFYQRAAENEDALAGAASEALKVTTKAAFTPGNVDGDEKNNVNLNDVVALAQIVAGWKDVTHELAALDPNGDGVVDLNDVVMLAQFVAGWDGIELSDKAYGSSTGTPDDGGNTDDSGSVETQTKKDVDIDVSTAK